MKGLPRPRGLKPPPRHAPQALRNTEDLRRLQRLMTHALVRPLAPGDHSPAEWGDGRTTAEVADEFIKSNDRLSAFERLQIYHRVYWYRIMGAAMEDSPGLRALLGERRFERMMQAYLAENPSRSFTLRNLLSRLPEFLRRHRSLTVPKTAGALAVAHFEWAQTVAFDGPSLPLLTPALIARTPPHRLRPALQPYLTLLDSAYAVDVFCLAVKRRNALRSEASNTSETKARKSRRSAAPRLRRQRTLLAVHRFDNQLYYKRLEAGEFRVLQALQGGRSVAQALEWAGRKTDPARIQTWFSTWMRLGWLCRRK